jgi:predicted enzyme related to lactoylglutathione lyase
MPTADTTTAGAPCWVDLMTTDVDRSREFYGQLFGWEAEEPNAEFGGYLTFTLNGTPVAGCMASQAETDTPVWSVYLNAADAAKTVDAAAEYGAQIIVPSMQVGDLGTMAVLGDPGGASIGLWQPGLHRGFGVTGEHGAPSWFELHTRDYVKALEFYRSVFQWQTDTVSDTPDFRYTVQTHGGEQLAGVMDSAGFLPEGVPSHWAVYFGADDTDAALDRIVALGGSVVLPAEDTPYGRLAGAADPNGAQFKLVANMSGGS